MRRIGRRYGVDSRCGWVFALSAKTSGAPGGAPLEEDPSLSVRSGLPLPLLFDLVHEQPDFVEGVAHFKRRFPLEYHLFAVG